MQLISRGTTHLIHPIVPEYLQLKQSQQPVRLQQGVRLLQQHFQFNGMLLAARIILEDQLLQSYPTIFREIRATGHPLKFGLISKD